jgi:hypothetical protein
MKLSIERKLKLLKEDEDITYMEYYIFHFADMDIEPSDVYKCRYFCGSDVYQERVSYFIRDALNDFIKVKR